jgi:RNA polymerase sigma-70 factor (ECF subfamily)
MRRRTRTAPATASDRCGIVQQTSAALDRTIGDDAAFALLYATLRRTLMATASRLVDNSWDAEDLVQEAFLRAFRYRPRFRGAAAPSTWVYRILVNACVDFRRRRVRHGVHLPLGEEPWSAATAAPVDLLETMWVSRALAALNSADRRVFRLCEIEGHTHTEVARRLGIAEGTSKWRLSVAKRRLREQLAAGAAQGRPAMSRARC